MSLPGEPPFILTVDAGTSSVRALLFDAAGNRVPNIEAHLSYQPTTTPDGGAFFDAEFLLSQARSCLEGVLSSAGDAEVAGVAIDTFWHSLVGVDAAGQPTTPVITWADTRPAQAARDLRQRLDEAEIHARTGCRLHSSYWPAKIAWLRHVDAGACRRTTHWLSFGDYLLWRLTGRLATSISLASGTGLLDRRTLEWDQPLLSALGVGPDHLPPVVLEPIQAAERTWLPPIGDGAASNIGSGCGSANRVAVNIGTSAAMRAILPRSTASQGLAAGLWCYGLDRKRNVLGGALSEGGNLWAWLRATLQLPPPDEEEAQLAALPPAGHDLTILPFIAGERSPGWADDARLTITGAGLHTTPVDLLRASLEAVAYRFALIYEDLLPALNGQPEIVASGGAILSSPTWLQILADVLDRPVSALADRQATSRGTALLALETLGRLPDVAGAAFPYSATYEPNRDAHRIYARALERQRGLYARLIP